MYGRSVCEDRGTMAGEAQKRKRIQRQSPGEQKKGQQQPFQGARHTGGMRIRPPPMFHEAGLPVPAATAGDEMSTYITSLNHCSRVDWRSRNIRSMIPFCP